MVRSNHPLIDKVIRFLWPSEDDGLAGPYLVVVKINRVIFAVIRDLSEGQLTLRAMSLVYFTLLSLVPLLAVSFSVLKGFGVHNQLRPLLLGTLTPLGDKGIEITDNIIGFVERVEAGALGGVGIALLFYTVLRLMQKIEAAFNYTWRVPEMRRFYQGFSIYLPIISIGPVLVFGSMALTGIMMNHEAALWLGSLPGLGWLIKTVSGSLPYLLIIGAFAFIYLFVPNTRVKLLPALIGATVAGLLWQTTGWGFAWFVANSNNYVAIYSAFATLIFFLIWIYVGWLILFIGASIAFYVQNPDYVSSARGDSTVSINMLERLAMLIMLKIAHNFYHNKGAINCKQIAITLNTPSNIIERLLNAMEAQMLIKQTNDKVPAYLPAKPLEHMSVKQVLDAVRYANEDYQLSSKVLPDDPQINDIFLQHDQALQDKLGQTTIKGLVIGEYKNLV